MSTGITGGMDGQIHTADGFDYYSVFHFGILTGPRIHCIPLSTGSAHSTISNIPGHVPGRGRLPVWELASNETNCMIGYHSIPVIVDAYMKGIRGFDTVLALEAMKKSANWNHFGLPAYRRNGMIAVEDEHESVSKTLEYAYDDWCIAMFARKTGTGKITKHLFAGRSITGMSLIHAPVSCGQERTAAGLVL